MSPTSTKELELYQKQDTEEFDTSPSMPLSRHLEELRKKIIISFTSFSVASVLGFYFSRDFISILTNLAPSDTIFLQIKPGEFFFTAMRIAVFLGVLLSSPVIIWQLGSFIFPGLNQKERKMIMPAVAAAPALFVLGCAFAYFFVAPSMLNFLFGFGKDIISTSISIESYISFTIMIMAICGFSFLIPILILGCANVGLINSKSLIRSWRYVILASVISGAVLTPTPDPFNMSIVSGILIGLYLISYGILCVMRR